MKLYSGDLSPYSAKVRMQIYAKGLEGIELDRPPGFLEGQFSKTSPIGRIPALDIDGDIIPESEVISEFLEETYPQPSLLGTTPRESAAIRTISRIGDIYIMNNIFMCLPQQRRAGRNDAIRDLFTRQVVRGLKALEEYIGQDGFAVGGRLTIADCTLVPALFLVEDVFPNFDVGQPLNEVPKVAAYWVAMKQNEHAARVLAELHRGLEERKALQAKAAAKAGA
jgi:glutathione S-transferase